MTIYTVFYQGILYQETDFGKLLEQIKGNIDLAFIIKIVMRNMTSKSPPFYVQRGSWAEMNLGGTIFNWTLKDDLIVAVREL